MANNAELRISRARTMLLLDQPWFGMLALRMKIMDGSKKGITTMANDGTRLLYNEEYVMGLEDSEVIAVMAHEVMHAALGHQYRAGSRNFKRWNVACDIAINQILRAEKFKLPFTELAALEPKYPNMSAEEIYAKLEEEDLKKPPSGGSGGQPQPQGQQQGNPGSGDEEVECECGLEPAGSGSDDMEPGEDIMSETDWQIAAEQAADVAKKAGKLPAHAHRAVSNNEKSVTDWRTLLRRFVEQTVPNNYSWMQPNRRYIAQGIYMPGIVKENTPRIGIAVDTSGSIDQVMLNQFAAEVTSIMYETRPEEITVVYCDAEVQKIESFTPDGGPVELGAYGGGGTEFQPALDVFNEDPPACVIYLTDLYGPAPHEPTDYPVLWAVMEGSRETPPFGELVKLSKYQ